MKADINKERTHVILHGTVKFIWLMADYSKAKLGKKTFIQPWGSEVDSYSLDSGPRG